MELNRHYEAQVCGVTLLCDVIPMGRDYTVCVRDDRCGHVGSAALSVSRPSLTGQGVSATTSVLNCLGHKDDAIACRFAEAVAVQQRCTAVCTCGVQIDGITPDQIQAVLDACEGLKNQVLQDLAAEG
ncbi:MAG: hypothetical protein LUC35_00600 [Clostridiales bacterium]|nr:hypothetical protein [Clostridiales bacterium]